jgi:hypothetical protein
MTRVLQASLTVALVTVTIGFAASQARAEPVITNVACFGRACLPGNATVGAASPMVDAISSASTAWESDVRAMGAVSFSAKSIGTFQINERAWEGRTRQINYEPSGPACAPVPEPASMLLLGTGLATIAAGLRRWRKKSTS